MHIIKPVLIEKVVHGVRGFGTDAEGRPVLVGTGTQVRNGTQEFIGMALLLKREGFRIGEAEHGHILGPHFPFLAFAGRLDKFARNGDARARVDAFQFVPCGGTLINNTLDVAKAGTVVEFEERKPLGVAAGPPIRISDAADAAPSASATGVRSIEPPQIICYFLIFARMNSITTGRTETMMMP